MSNTEQHLPVCISRLGNIQPKGDKKKGAGQAEKKQLWAGENKLLGSLCMYIYMHA